MLYYNVYRWYEAAAGRYTRPDPWGIDGSGPNVYLYARGNPLFLTDPDGRRVRFEGFSMGDQTDAAVAVTWIKDTLKKTPCCVKEGRAQQILDVIDSPNRDIVLKYRPDMKPSNCGFTPLSR